jgi:hypothetical protein
MAAAAARALALPLITNVDQLFQGYNLILSDPFSAVDAGIQRAVFAMNYTQNRTTADGKWAVPDAVTVSASASCSYSSSVSAFETITSGAAFQAALLSSIVGVQVGVDGTSILQAAFTSSSMYEDFTSATAVGATVGVGASAECSVYTAFLDATTMPSLSADLVAAVNAIDPLDPAPLLALINNFGTHYRSRATFGASYMTFTRISFSAYDNFTQEGFGFAQVAQLALLQSIGVDISHSAAYAAYMEMMSVSVDAKVNTFAKPSAPQTPPGGDPSDTTLWAASVALGTTPGPQIIRSNLAPIYSLLTAANFPALDDIAVRASALTKLIDMGLCRYYPKCAYVNPFPVVAYFPAACPAQWVPYQPAAGFALVPVNGSASLPAPGVSSGNAWLVGANGLLDDPGHAHNILLPIPVPPHEKPCGTTGNSYLQLPGTFTVAGEADPVYMSKLVKVSQQVTCFLPPTLSAPSNYTFPTGAYAFFDFASTPACPSGWALDPTLPYGYALVPNAETNLVTTEPPVAGAVVHGHAISGSISSAAPVNYLSDDENCGSVANQGGAANTGLSGASAPFPYLPLLFCKNVQNTDIGVSPRRMMVFAQDCNTLDTDVGPSWYPSPSASGSFVLSSVNKSGQINGGAAIVAGTSNSIQPHTHNNHMTLQPGPGCESILLDTACGGICNRQSPGCGFGLVSSDFAPSSGGMPPFLQMQLCSVGGE